MSGTKDTDEALGQMEHLCVGRNPEMFRSVLERIGDKWSLLLIGLLGDGPLRFTQLLRATPGISRRMLTHTLRALERDGLVTRTIYAEVPPRVDYEVTELGRSLLHPVLALASWAGEHQDAIIANRDVFDGDVGI